MKRTTRSAERFVKVILAICIAAAAMGRGAYAATCYWDTTSGTWGTGTNWSDNSVSGGTTGIVPGSGDSAVFNQSSVNGGETIQLDAPYSITGLTFNNTGTTLIESSSTTTQALTIGTSGITVNSGAGAVIIGDANNPSPITLNGNQNWTTAAGTRLTVVGDIANPGANGTYYFLIQGAGTTTLSNGSVTLHLPKTGGFVENGGTLTLSSNSLITRVDDDRGANGVGLSSANNTLNVGAGSSFGGHTYFRLGTGGYGNNKLYVSNGGTFTTPYRWDLGNLVSNVAEVDGDGSTMSLTGPQNNPSGGTIKATSGGTAYVICANGKVSSTLNYIVSGTDPTTGAAAVLNVGSSLYLNVAAGNTLSATSGGLLEFTSAAPTMSFFTRGSVVSINGGGLSYKNATEVDMSANQAPAANTVGAFTWQGNNAFRLNGSTETGAGAYTFANNLGATNYTALQLYGTCSISRAVTFDGDNGGSLLLNGATATVGGGVTLTGAVTFTAKGAASSLTGVIGGSGTLLKAGSGTLTLASLNTYTGATIVSNGVLRLTNPAALATNTSVYLSDGATLDLAFTGTNQVAALYTNGIPLPAGVYGSTDVVGLVTGGGYLQVAGGGAVTPTARFTASPTNGYAPLKVVFTDTSSDGGSSITNRHWDFGDSNTLDTTGTLVTNTYAGVGAYTVQLTVAGPDGSSTSTRPNLVSVGAVPQPTFEEGSEFSLNSSGQARFHIETTNGVQYRIAYKVDLLNSNGWQGVTPPIPDGWTNGNNLAITLQDTNALGVTQRFYRIEAKSADAP